MKDTGNRKLPACLWTMLCVSSLLTTGCVTDIFGGPGGRVYVDNLDGELCDPCELDTTLASGEVFVAAPGEGYSFDKWQGYTCSEGTASATCTIEQSAPTGIPQFDNLTIDFLAAFKPIILTSASDADLTGLWVQYADVESTETGPDENIHSRAKVFSVFRIVDVGNGEVAFRECAGLDDPAYMTSLPFSNGVFVLPLGSISVNRQLAAPQTMTVVDNRNLACSDFSVESHDGDYLTSEKITNCYARKIRNDMSSPIGEASVGAWTTPVNCYEVSHVSGSGTITDNGVPDVPVTFEGTELWVSCGQSCDLEIAQHDAIIDGEPSDEGYAEYHNWYQNSHGVNGSSAIFSAQCEPSHTLCDGASTVGTNTSVGIHIDLTEEQN